MRIFERWELGFEGSTLLIGSGDDISEVIPFTDKGVNVRLSKDLCIVRTGSSRKRKRDRVHDRRVGQDMATGNIQHDVAKVAVTIRLPIFGKPCTLITTLMAIFALWVRLLIFI